MRRLLHSAFALLLAAVVCRALTEPADPRAPSGRGTTPRVVSPAGTDDERAQVDLGAVALARRNGWDLGRHRLVVTVREDGQPVAGALVFAGWYHDSSPDWANVRTDARGQVRLLVDWVPVRVSATAPGRRAAERHLAASRERDVEVALHLEPTRGVRGTVVDERGVPVVGAGVLLQSLTDRSVQRWAASDDLGEFALDEVPGGPFLVSATEPASSDGQRITAPVVASSSGPIVLVLEPAATVMSVSAEWSRAPEIERQAADGGWYGLRAHTSGPRGCAYDAAPGLVRARRRWSGATTEPRRVGPGERLTLEAPVDDEREGRTVRGTVRRGDGTPIDCADVEAFAEGWSVRDCGDSTDERGAFRLWLPRRALTLRVDAGAPAPLEAPLPAGGDLDLGTLAVADAP